MNHNIGRYARLGGVAVSKDREHMSRIGKIGGTKVSQNREHMSRIGKIGGAHSHSPHLKYVISQRTQEILELQKQGIQIKTIAEKFGMSESGVYQAIRQGKKKLNGKNDTNSSGLDRTTPEIPIAA
jgi:DNA-binding NarL/FixJ family response regulator